MSLKIRKGPVIDPGLCRCCGVIKKCRLLNIEYDYFGDKEVYSEMFVDCFGLLLSNLDGDEKDRLICATCVTRLREACSFRRQVLSCEEMQLQAKIQPDDNENIQTGMKLMATEEIDNLAYSHSELIDNVDDEDNQPLINFSKCDTELTVEQSNRKHKKRKAPLIFKKRNTKKVYKSDYKRNIESVTDCVQNKKLLSNIVTIVENSFICPFNTFYSFYFCYFCRKKFVYPEKLLEHSLTHDPACYRDVLSNLTQKNKKCQIDISRIDCRLCPEKITDIDTFKRHITKVHGKKLYAISNEFLEFKLTSNNLECIECNKNFATFYALKKHMAEHFATFICDICGAHYFEQRMLIGHLKSHKPNSINFPCKQCGKNFKVKYNLQIHIARIHTKEPVYLCSKCDISFFSDSLRHRHMIEVHNEDASFKCDLCDKIYVTRKGLREHNRRVHLNISKHECHLCDKSFYLPSRLKEHLSCHTGERNFRCENCGKSFQRLRTLKAHIQSHSSDKKYKCKLCSASYSQNVCLKNHVKRQHKNEIEDFLN